MSGAAHQDARSSSVAAPALGGGPLGPALAVELVVGGKEAVAPLGGLEYSGTESVVFDPLRGIEASSEGWDVEVCHESRAAAPRAGLSLKIRRAPEAPEALLRDVVVTFTYALGDLGDWVLNVPGNLCRADLAVAGLTEMLGVFAAGDTFGSPAVIALSRVSAPQTAVLWPVCPTELGLIDVDVDHDAAQLRVTIRTGLAARMAPGGPGVAWGTVHLDQIGAGWADVREELPAWSERLGLHAPLDAPEWIRRAHIYEAHVGFSVFDGGVRYERYADVAALTADLERIQALGFDVVQLMPRHPYPSYNVCDYADVTTTYGDEEQVRALVDACHDRGMRVLLDVIMHGVIDQEVMADTLAGVHSGPFADRLRDGTLDLFARGAEDVAWARHIVEYAPYWHDGSPARHPLADEHPAWFMRDAEGEIARRYTKAFDIANPAWQEYFLDSCVELVEGLGADGLRVDAPTYNNFPTWAPGRAGHASDGPMASLPLLRALRSRLRAVSPDVVVYTEPTGGLFRAVADATYNYDEHWLIEALFDKPHRLSEQRLIRDARELARWLADRERALPPGSAIVHHIDSHDSIWWRLPGAQFKRERFGREAAVALMAVFAFGGGGYMTFMGGEDEIEDELGLALALRRRLPELVDGVTDRGGPTVSSDDVFAIVRRGPKGASLVAVNLSRAPVRCTIGLPDAVAAERLFDHFNDEWIDHDAGAEVVLDLAPLQPRVLRLGGREER